MDEEDSTITCREYRDRRSPRVEASRSDEPKYFEIMRPHPEISRRTSKRLGLTRRESEILQLLAEDKSLHEIARETHVSYVTVRNHVQHILAKLGVHSIIEAVACHLLVRD
jgi:DNA-binding NarL/FixJ family response regulator